MTTKLVAQRLGTTLRHAARLAVIINVKRIKNWYFDWDENNLKEAKKILLNREKGKGRFTLGQVR